MKISGEEYAAHDMPECPDFTARDGLSFIDAAGKEMQQRRLKKTPQA